MERLTIKQVKDAVKKLTRQLKRPPTFNEIQEFFELNSKAHARYYVMKGVEAGALTIDDRRSPHWIEVVK
jgi:DNA-directed RNA polymerase specialized sigma subunit